MHVSILRYHIAVVLSKKLLVNLICVLLYSNTFTALSLSFSIVVNALSAAAAASFLESFRFELSTVGQRGDVGRAHRLREQIFAPRHRSPGVLRRLRGLVRLHLRSVAEVEGSGQRPQLSPATASRISFSGQTKD